MSHRRALRPFVLLLSLCSWSALDREALASLQFAISHHTKSRMSHT
ncbi:hypothetical protein HMPREF1989_01859 [Porphyromonas gingivalis F0566]|nr:hypothetical protein HMPREF1989_01859 [Porphyromonas gingivalis F0566]